MLLSEGEMSDYKGAVLMLHALPRAKALLGDRCYDVDGFRKTLAERYIAAGIPSEKSPKTPIRHDLKPYRQRYKIENMFGGLKDWRRIHPRYDRCAHLHILHLHRRDRCLLDQSMSHELSHSNPNQPTAIAPDLNICHVIPVA